MTALQVGVAVLLIGAFLVVALSRELLWPMPGRSAKRGYPSPEELVADLGRLASGNAEAATAFAKRAEDVHAQRRDSARRLEDKAATTLSFVGGGSGLIALAAGTDKIVHVRTTPLLVVACIFLFGVLVSSILVQVPRSSAVFNARRLCNLELLQSSAGAARIAVISGWEFLEAARDMAGNVRIKANWLTYSQILFAFGVAAIVLNVLCAPPDKTETAVKTSVRCISGSSSLNCQIEPQQKATP